MKKIVSILAIAAVTFSLVACNTTRGVRRGIVNPSPTPGNYGMNKGRVAGVDPNTGNTLVTPAPYTTPGTNVLPDTTRDGNLGYGMRPGAASPTPGTNVGTAQGTGGIAYKDGTFVGEGDKNSRAAVTIRNGRIVSVDLKRTDAKGNIINDNPNLGNTPGGGATSNIGQTKHDLANAIVQNQSADIVTSTTGDTDLVNDWKLAVRRALDRARR